MSEPAASEMVQLTLADAGGQGKFRYSAENLSEPEAGKEDRLFDWHHGTTRILAGMGGVEGIAQALYSDIERGLTTEEATDPERIELYGSNAVKEREALSYWALIWEQLHDFTLLVLIGAAVVSIVLGILSEGIETGWLEGVAILVAVLIVLNVTAANDMQKDRQFRQLNAINNRKLIKVMRDGRNQEVVIDNIVTGDLVLLAAGDQVPADGIFVAGANLKMDESKLTGESDMVRKDRGNPFLVSSTECHEGECRMLVVAVGQSSVFGRMRSIIDADTDSVTPLQLKLETLATQLSKLGFAVGSFTVLVMIITHLVLYFSGDGTVNDEGEPKWTLDNWSSILSYFITGVTILVVAIPEGLPLAVTIALAYSVKRMMKDNNLVRHLDACETMGGANTICSDKTGTLTQNRMTVMQAWVHSAGWPLLSRFESNDATEVAEFLQRCRDLPRTALLPLLHNSCLNSSAYLSVNAETGEATAVGSSTEAAMLQWTQRLDVDYQEVRAEFPVLREQDQGREAPAYSEVANPSDLPKGVVFTYPFTSARKRSSVLVRLNEGEHKYRLYVKGASEIILRLSTHVQETDGSASELDGSFHINSEGKASGAGTKLRIVQDVINPMADEALRTIALAYRDFEGPQEWDHMVEYATADGKGTGECPAVEDGLVLVGIVGIQDPVRPEVPSAVLDCQNAGVFVRMVTGDNVNTARAIARQCNVFRPEGYVDGQGQHWPAGVVLEGPRFRAHVGGLALPPHFDHECRCKDYSGLSVGSARHPDFVEGYHTPAYPVHYGYPSIVDHISDHCAYWSAELVARRGHDRCNDECKQRGCRRQMKNPNDKREEQRYMVVKHQAVFDRYVNSLQVLARSAPADKHLLVTGLMERRQVVAVTGDGTNDGPALSKANVGFAMGVTGTEVAKEAADIILLDDNFTSIVKATMWGRNVYDSIRKFLQFQLTVNVVALAFAFVAAAILKDAPLRAVQMLWVNLIMDTFASLALATELPTRELLNRPPYGRDDSLVNRLMLRNVLGHACFQLIVLCFLAFRGDHIFNVPIGTKLGHSAEPTVHFTLIFHTFVFMQLFNEINARCINNEINVFRRIHTNPMFLGIWVGTAAVQFVIVQVGGNALKVRPLTWEQHLICVLLGSLSLVVGQLLRFVPDHMFIDLRPKHVGDEATGWVALISRKNTRRSSFSLRSVTGGSHVSAGSHNRSVRRLSRTGSAGGVV